MSLPSSSSEWMPRSSDALKGQSLLVGLLHRCKSMSHAPSVSSIAAQLRVASAVWSSSLRLPLHRDRVRALMLPRCVSTLLPDHQQYARRSMTMLHERHDSVVHSLHTTRTSAPAAQNRTERRSRRGDDVGPTSRRIIIITIVPTAPMNRRLGNSRALN